MLWRWLTSRQHWHSGLTNQAVPGKSGIWLFCRPVLFPAYQLGRRTVRSTPALCSDRRNSRAQKQPGRGNDARRDEGRRQALIFMITNSGHDKTSVCYDYHSMGVKLPKARLRMTVSFLSFVPWTKEKTHSRTSPAGKSKPLSWSYFYRSLPA